MTIEAVTRPTNPASAITSQSIDLALLDLDRCDSRGPRKPDSSTRSKPGFDTRIRIAESRAELDAVYRFRYRVYFEEFGRCLGTPDHERKMVVDGDDEQPFTTILYAGTPDRITGTVRLRHWAPGEVPDHDVEELSLDRFPDLSERRIAEIGRLMVRRSLRGKRVVEDLLKASYEFLVGRQGTELTFCYCSPGLVRYYRRLAMRPYGGKAVAAPDGLMVPLVAVNSDLDYYVRHRSPLAPLVRRFFAQSARRVLELSPYRSLFDNPDGIDLRAEALRRAAQWLRSAHPAYRAARCLDALPAETRNLLIEDGVILDSRPGLLMTRKGFREQELYLVLEGRFVIEDGSDLGRTFGPGQVFGTDTIRTDSSDRRRCSSVRALTPGRVLVVPGRALLRALRRNPALALALTTSGEGCRHNSCGRPLEIAEAGSVDTSAPVS